MGTDQSTLLGSDYAVSQTNCRIVVLGPKSGDKALLALSQLPSEARIVATGTSLAEIQKDGDLYSEVLSKSDSYIYYTYQKPFPTIYFRAGERSFECNRYQ